MTEINESILIIDDEEMIRLLISQKLGALGYSCKTASNAKEAEKLLNENSFALVLLDISMPGKSGAVLLPEITSRYPDTAVVMATAINDTEVAVQCMRDGAYDYVTKPLNMNDLVNHVTRALERRRLKMENQAYRIHLEEMVATRTVELQHALGRLETASLDTIHRLATAAEYRDEDTGNHIKRMSLYCTATARRLGMGESEVENILYAAPMHDIGKIGIPDRILLKPGPLTPDEWEIMKQHTTIGGKILAHSEADFIRLGEEIALTHHEKWDGSGYPKGLKGDDIPMSGRIAAVADVFDALVSKRPYKIAYAIDKALEVMKEKRGTHFDPDVTDAFLAIKDGLVLIMSEHQDTDLEGDKLTQPFIQGRGIGVVENALSPG